VDGDDNGDLDDEELGGDEVDSDDNGDPDDEELDGDEVDGDEVDGDDDVNDEDKGVSPMYLNGNRSSGLGTIPKRELPVPRMMK
jgi:hypothetical protein